MIPMITTVRAPGARARALAATVATLAIIGCGGGGGGGTTNPPPPPTGNFTLSIAGAPITLARSTNGTVTVNVVRTNSFAETVTLSVSGLPAGVTSGLNPAQVFAGAAFSTLTLTVGANAVAGTSTVTVTGSANGVNNQTATFQLIVTTPPAQTGPFTLSMSATSYLIHPLNLLPKFPLLTITRNPGFTGSVAFTSSGLPNTLVLAFTPSGTTGSTTTVNVVPAGTTPNGTYTAAIRGASPQGDQTITFSVVVAPVTTGAIKWKWCSGSLPRFFFAVKDGSGPWTRIMPSGTDTSFSFNLSSGRGQVAEVALDDGGYRTTIWSLTTQEMVARAAAQCTLINNVSTRTVNGSFGGVTGFRTSQVGMGWWFGSANGNGSFTLLNLPAGPLDLFAARSGELIDPSAIPIDRMIIRRGVNPASGSTIPVVDFGAAESFAPTTATWTFAPVGEVFSVTQAFLTSGGTTGHFNTAPAIDGTALARTVYGVPLAQTISGDLHQVVATVRSTGTPPNDPTRASRQIVAYSRTIGNRALSFGPVMPSPTVQPIAGAPAGRLRFQGTLPVEYNQGVTLDMTQVVNANANNSVTIHASSGFLNTAGVYDLSVPDLTAAIGWDTQFALRTGQSVRWWASGGGATLDWYDVRYLFNTIRSRWTGIATGIIAPVDGATYFSGRATGTVTP
jgi:hypothetical protein